MNELSDLLSAFAVDVIYKGTHAIATVVASSLAPLLLIMSIYIRLMETQLDAVVGSGKFGVALRDILGWTFVLGVYFALGNLVTEYFNSIYAWADSVGSVKKIIDTFPAIMEKAGYSKDQESKFYLSDVFSAPYALLAEAFYFLSLIVLAALSAFLRMAGALCFGIAFIWGLIAVPISISTTFRILRGWGLLLSFALVWPVIEALILGLMGLCFAEAASKMHAATGGGDSAFVIANIKYLLSVCNIVVCAALIAAPFIANALVSNTSAAAGVVMPFVGAALAAGKAASKGLKEGVKKLGSGPVPPAPPPVPTPRSTPQPPSNPQGPKQTSPASPQTPNGPSANSVSSSPSSSPAAKARQQRRGAIINANRKAGSPVKP